MARAEVVGRCCTSRWRLRSAESRHLSRHARYRRGRCARRRRLGTRAVRCRVDGGPLRGVVRSQCRLWRAAGRGPRGTSYAIYRQCVGSPEAKPEAAKIFAALAAIDFFPGEARGQADAALQEFELAANRVLSPDEPHAITRSISTRRIADYQGRTWATRRRPWVDRLACAWLIRRFIDDKAVIMWLDTPRTTSAEGARFRLRRRRVQPRRFARHLRGDADELSSRDSGADASRRAGALPRRWRNTATRSLRR